MPLSSTDSPKAETTTARWVPHCEQCGYSSVLNTPGRTCPECGYRFNPCSTTLHAVTGATLETVSGLQLVLCTGVVMSGIATAMLAGARVDGPRWIVMAATPIAIAAGLVSTYGLSRLGKLINFNAEQALRAARTKRWTVSIVAWSAMFATMCALEWHFSASSHGVGSYGWLIVDGLLLSSAFGVLRMHAVSLHVLSVRFQTLDWQCSASRCRQWVRHGWWASGLLWALMMGGCAIGLVAVVWHVLCLIWMVVGHVAASRHAASCASSIGPS